MLDAALRTVGRAPVSLLATFVLLLSLVALADRPARTEAADVALARADRPNVLLIVADDMRPDGLDAMPNLRALAERGITFQRAYATTPLCCPSRASILTGLYSHRHGVLANEPPEGGFDAFDDRSTLATWLQGAGVRTGLVGRYLNEYRSLYIPPGWDFWYAFQQHGTHYHDYRINAAGRRIDFGSRPEQYSTRVLGTQLHRFLGQEQARPFFLLFTPRAPHGWPVPDALDKDVYRDLPVSWPPSFNEQDVSDKPSWIQRLEPLSDEEQARYHEFRRRQHETLIGLDRAIGSTVESLRAGGRLDSTWIIFTADNGRTIGEHRIDVGKGCAHEECVRVPLVVVPPGGLATPRSDDHLVANIDLAPTLAAIAGIEPGLPVDGRSLLPLVADAAPAWRSALLLEQRGESEDTRFAAVRTPEAKYVRYANGEEELYVDAEDPYELENRARDPARAADVAALSEMLTRLLEGGLR